MSVLGLTKNTVAFLRFEREITDPSGNIKIKSDGTIECLDLIINGVDFQQYIEILLAKYPSAGINQYIKTPFSLYNPIDQFAGGFPSLNQF